MNPKYCCEVEPDNVPDLVAVIRCKNCNKRGTSECYVENASGELAFPWIPPDDWFCASGEHVEDETKPTGRFNRELNEWFYWCPGCNGHVDKGDKFCRHCGKQLDWEHGITELPYGR